MGEDHIYFTADNLRPVIISERSKSNGYTASGATCFFPTITQAHSACTDDPISSTLQDPYVWIEHLFSACTHAMDIGRELPMQSLPVT